jgi:DNA-directed RNA polymerase specialized sigma subunit
MARKRSKANYFTKETEEAINRYNRSDDPELRAQIFTDEIYYPFYKLAENIIHTFKFYYTDVDNLEDLKHEIVTVLLEEKIDKFDPTNGAKAFSYFGTIVKRWLINYNNKNYKQLKKRGTFEEFDDYRVSIPELEETNAIPLGTFIDEYVEYMYDELEVLFDKSAEQQIADAVLTIFKTRHDLDIFKKKALYIYIREMTDCKTPHLTKVIKVLKQEFYEMYEELHERGLIVR